MKVTFGCCFCGEDIEKPDEFQVVGVWNLEKKQTWWCHEECFVSALKPEFRVFGEEEALNGNAHNPRRRATT